MVTGEVVSEWTSGRGVAVSRVKSLQSFEHLTDREDHTLDAVDALDAH